MITRFWLGRRRDSLSRPAFSAHWFGVHAAYGLALPGPRAYVQNHRLPRTAGTTPPTFDCCSELDFDDVDAMRTAFRSPQI
ncbi:MAG: EthD domain-containing protein, partial [Nitriliruptoraceae bacterium]